MTVKHTSNAARPAAPAVTPPQYELKTPPAGHWSHSEPVPAIGKRVSVLVNRLGTGTVESYFIEAGFTGIIVKLDAPPAWHIEQCKGGRFPGKALVFGAEIVLLPDGYTPPPVPDTPPQATRRAVKAKLGKSRRSTSNTPGADFDFDD